ncbi:MAG: nucleoside-diphosphate kinase [Rhizobiaceae bacterium]|nr:nucleoside-diphosphate kinase [Rhizobiaceae bacterium]MCV0407211.1 nucleoside-diphosphate kinase [Rhizobiaceae bacterium]
MSTETFILTTKDFTILEVMRDRCLGDDDPLAPILDRKIGSAVVTLLGAVPGNVVTMSSRVSYSVHGREADTRVISHTAMASPVGMFLPVTTPRGLALLGLAEGEEFEFINAAGARERIRLEKVHYQPEAARREKESRESTVKPLRRPMLGVIGGGFGKPALSPSAGSDDPGPSAA